MKVMSQGVVSFFICFHVIFFTSLVPTMCPKTPLHYQNFLFMPVPEFLDAEPLTKKTCFWFASNCYMGSRCQYRCSVDIYQVSPNKILTSLL
jgi:hypothetical protein